MSDHTALVVGGTSGIGLATARRLNALGAAVHVVGRSQERLDEVAVTDPALTGHRADGGDRDEIAAVAEAIGEIDWLIVALSGQRRGRARSPTSTSTCSAAPSTPSSGATSPPSRRPCRT